MKVLYTFSGLVLTVATTIVPLNACAGNGSDNGNPGHGISERNKSHYYAALGTALAPEYEGSDYYELYPFGIARWMKRGRFAEFAGSSLRANVIAESLWQFGPVLHWQRSRDDVDSGPVDRMRDIDDALEAGAFFGAMLRDPDLPRRYLGLKVEALQDVTGVHHGHTVNLSLNAGTPLDNTWAVNAGVTATYGSGDYMNTYFGVDADNARRSGLAPFAASSGFRDVAFYGRLACALTDHWGMAMAGRYQRLLGDAADSPVVAEEGSADQYVLTLTATYRY